MMFMPAEEFFEPKLQCSPWGHRCSHSRTSLRNQMRTSDLFPESVSMFMNDPFFRDFSIPMRRRRRAAQQPRSLRDITVNDLIERVGKLIGEENLTHRLAIHREEEKEQAASEKQSTTEVESRLESGTLPQMMQKITESVMSRHGLRCCQLEKSDTKDNECTTVSENNQIAVDSRDNFFTFGDWLSRVSSVMDREFDNTKKNHEEVCTGKALFIQEDGQNFKVDIKTGDFKPEEIQVKIKDGFVTILAKREERNDEQGMLKSQRLERMVKLPSNVNSDELQAEMNDGMLTLTAPKEVAKEEPKERIIGISRRKVLTEGEKPDVNNEVVIHTEESQD